MLAPGTNGQQSLRFRRKLKRDPELFDLIEFVSEENLRMNDPVFSKEAVEQSIKKKPVKCGTKLSIYATGSTEYHVLDRGDKIANCIIMLLITCLTNALCFWKRL